METWLGDSIVLAWAGIGFAVLGFSYAVYARRRSAEENKKNTQEIINEVIDGINAEKIAESPGKFHAINRIIQSAPSITKLNKAVAKAVSVQTSAKSTEAHKRAREAWRTAALIAEEDENDEVAVHAWFSIGYLIQGKSPGYKRGDHDSINAVIFAYDKALRINPNNAKICNNRGLAKAALGDRQAAIADFDRALEINPNNVAAYNNRGAEKAALGDRQAAIADFDKALEINPNNAAVYYNRGLSKAALGDRQAAIADFDRALEINPSLILAYQKRGNQNFALGRKNEARNDFMAMLDLARKSGRNDWMASAEKELKALGDDESP